VSDDAVAPWCGIEPNHAELDRPETAEQIRIKFLLSDAGLVQRTRNLVTYVPEFRIAAERLGVPVAFIEAVIGRRDVVGKASLPADGPKTGVQLESARLLKARTAPRSPTPLEKERKRLEAARGEHARAAKRPFARAKKNGLLVVEAQRGKR